MLLFGLFFETEIGHVPYPERYLLLTSLIKFVFIFCFIETIRRCFLLIHVDQRSFLSLLKILQTFQPLRNGVIMLEFTSAHHLNWSINVCYSLCKKVWFSGNIYFYPRLLINTHIVIWIY